MLSLPEGKFRLVCVFPQYVIVHIWLGSECKWTLRTLEISLSYNWNQHSIKNQKTRYITRSTLKPVTPNCSRAQFITRWVAYTVESDFLNHEPVWVIMWALRFISRRNIFPHWLHINDFSVLCTWKLKFNNINFSFFADQKIGKYPKVKEFFFCFPCCLEEIVTFVMKLYTYHHMVLQIIFRPKFLFTNGACVGFLVLWFLTSFHMVLKRVLQAVHFATLLRSNQMRDVRSW